MTTVFIDTSVVMYAAGQPHPHRAACREVLRQVAAGTLAGVTSTEVVQEILHRFSHGDREVGAAMAASTIDLFGDLLTVDRRVIADTVDRFAQSPGLSARDAIHAATCRARGIDRIVSTDRGFDAVADLTRVDPASYTA